MDELHETTLDLDDDPDTVWDALTDPPGVEAWLGEGSALPPVEGAELDVTDAETGTRRSGRVDRVEPGRRLTYTWWPTDGDAPHDASVVTIRLTPHGSGTRLVVTERPIGASASIQRRVDTGVWPWRLASVELVLIGTRLQAGTIRC